MTAGQVGAGFPSAWPQPGIASFAPPDAAGAESPLALPQRAIDPRSWSDMAYLQALGIQTAMGQPHIRALIGDLLDKALRMSFKPQVPPPWIEKPYRGTYFGGAVINDANVSATDGIWNTLENSDGTIAEFTVPEGHMGVIKEFANLAAIVEQWTYVAWRLTIDGRPIPPLADICCQYGSMETPRRLTIMVPGGSTVRLQVEVKTGGEANYAGMGAYMLGWYWPVPNEGNVDNAHGQATVA